MYAFVDQQVDRLAPRSAFPLWVIRGWTHAAARGLCPPDQLATGFTGVGALPALPSFHRFLALLNACAASELAVAPLGHSRVTEDEAVLLQLWQDALSCPARARDTLAMLVDRRAAAQATELLLSGAARLEDATLGTMRG